MSAALADRPAISVIVPSFGRPDDLRELLAALCATNAPGGGFEVVIVDDGSPQPLAPAVRESAGGLDVVVVRTANGGPAAARNAGLERARGALVAFTDDDCRPGPDWLVALAAAHAEHPEALLGGSNVTALKSNPWAQATQSLEDAVYARANGEAVNSRFFASKNLAGPRAGLLAAGAFDVRFRNSEDRELCERWRRDGGQMVSVPGAVVAHANPRSGRVFWRQHLGYGRGAFHFHRMNRRRGQTGLRPDPADYASFVREPLRGPRRGQVPRLVVLALVIASQAASAAGYWLEAVRSACFPAADGDRATAEARAAANGAGT